MNVEGLRLPRRLCHLAMTKSNGRFANRPYGGEARIIWANDYSPLLGPWMLENHLFFISVLFEFC